MAQLNPFDDPVPAPPHLAEPKVMNGEPVSEASVFNALLAQYGEAMRRIGQLTSKVDQLSNQIQPTNQGLSVVWEEY